MTKQQAISLFGGVGKLARALGITSQAVSLWQDGELPERRANEIIGAAVRLELWPCGNGCVDPNSQPAPDQAA